MHASFRLLVLIGGVTLVAVGALAWLVLVGTLPAGAQDGQASPAQIRLLVALGAILIAGVAALVASVSFIGHISRRVNGMVEEVEAILERGDSVPHDSSPADEIVGGARSRLHALAARTRVALDHRERIEREARTDALTGLPNRRALDDFLAAALAGVRAVPDSFPHIGVLHVDLDHFKSVNDRLGHEAGDYVLQAAARRMQSVLRDSDMLARLGGDEFVVVVPGLEEADVLEGLTKRLVAQFSTPIQYREHNCMIGASAGAVLANGADEQIDPRSMLAQADIALCHAKATGRNRAAIFSDEMAEQLSKEERQADEIRDAVLDDAFEPWFQPMIDVSTGAVTGVELLSRWQHPERGLVPPREFLVIAEMHGMLEEIGLQVLEKACRSFQRWRTVGLQVPRLYVNMTRSQLLAPAAVDKISWILDDHNVPPDCVALEISERDLGERSADLLYANLRRLANLGVEKVLDDFGVGDGAMRNAVAIGAAKLKCARALVEGLADPERRVESRAMLHGAIGMAAALRAKPVAKGVEEAAWITPLQEMGFREMQGDGLARPMSSQDLPDWLADQARQARSA
ncbi:MAG: EAL domain-containing protein [Pseudomonadota bacterium]